VKAVFLKKMPKYYVKLLKFIKEITNMLNSVDSMKKVFKWEIKY
jgi:hypothetical protein